MPSPLRSSLVTVAVITLSAHAARADEPVPTAASASASAPSAATPITANCTLGAHAGIDDDDARTSADVVCHELASHGVNAPHEVRMGKLGGRILLTVSGPEGEKRVLLQGVDEIPVAAPRIAEASVVGRPVAEVENVDTVVGSEARAPRMKAGQMGFKGGMLGAMPIGAQTAPAPGVALGLLYRGGRYGIEGSLRVGGGGGSSTTLGHLVLGTGAHYYWSDGDFSPYTGGGLALMSFKLNRDSGESVGNTGLGVYAEAGIEAMRTHRTALTVGIRADVPLFGLTASNSFAGSYYPPGSAPARPSAEYVVPVSLMVGVIFH